MQPHKQKNRKQKKIHISRLIVAETIQKASENTYRSLAVDELRDIVLGERSKSESER